MQTYLKNGNTRDNKLSVTLARIMRLTSILGLYIILFASCNSMNIPENTPGNSTDPRQTPAPSPKHTNIPTQEPKQTATLTYISDREFTPTTTSTRSPTTTSTRSPTPTSEPPGRIAAIIQVWDSVGGLEAGRVDVLDENFNFLYRFTTHYIVLNSISPDGCHLHGITYSDSDGSFQIYEFNLTGAETQRITALSKEVEDESEIYQYSLSPSGRWLAYKSVDQILMSVWGAAIQNVKLLKVDEKIPQDVLQLTQRGGARRAKLSWSPDSRYLAYTDYDEFGIMQIYLYDPEEQQQYQITRFGQEALDHEIVELDWSHDSLKIAFLTFEISETESSWIMTDRGARGVISIPDFGLKWLNWQGIELYESSWGIVERGWWSRDDQMLLLPYVTRTENWKEYLVWYDLKTDKVVHSLSASDQATFSFAFPLNDLDKIGLSGAGAFYTYSRDTQEVIKKTMNYFLIENSAFLIPQNGPIDPAQCSP